MIQRVFLNMVLPLMVILSGCKYRKGDMYTSTLPGDSLNYVVMAAGPGTHMSEKASDLKLQHEYKGNVCQIKYVSDSASLNDLKGILLFNSLLPEVENDMLTKGFFGTFTSKQKVIYVLVSDQDFEQYFRKKGTVKVAGGSGSNSQLTVTATATAVNTTKAVPVWILLHNPPPW